MTANPTQNLDPEKIDCIDEELNKGLELQERGRWSDAEKHFRAAWDLVPEPKYDWDTSKRILRIIARFFRDKGDVDEAKRWIKKIYDDCRIALYDAEPDFIAGTIYYEAGELDVARRYLEKAYRISKGRAFHGEDIKYLKFVKEKSRER